MIDAWPNGLRGQAFVAGIALFALLLTWFGAIAPAWSWFDERQALLNQRKAVLQHMRDAAATLPQLRMRAANDRGHHDLATGAMLSGSTDTLAAAELQERLQRMAAEAGVSLAAIETIPAHSLGDWNKVSLRIGLNTQWTNLMDFLRLIEGSLIRIDDIDIHSAGMATRSNLVLLRTLMVVSGFRSAEADPGA